MILKLDWWETGFVWRVVLLIATVGQFVAPWHVSAIDPPTDPPERTTGWLEEQIDSFVNKAQENGDPTDIQISSCKISGQQLVATAQATIARALKGACNPGQFEDKFHNLETQLGEQLNVIKTMIISLEEKVVQMDQDLKRNLRGGASVTIGQNTATRKPFQPTSRPAPSVTLDDLTSDPDDLNPPNTNVFPRSEEVARYNSTVAIENGRRVFSYYWAVPGMSYKLRSWSLRRSLESTIFYIFPGGYRMYLKVIPRYTPDTMYVLAGLTRGDYDDMLSWPFKLKVRISVLSMETHSGAEDLRSRIWDPTVLCSGTNWRKPIGGHNPECLGLGFPHDVIKSSEYVHNDQTIIKLSVYLD